MNSTQMGLRKITIAVPAGLVDFADQMAQATGSNRSQIISKMLEQAQRRQLEERAAEGYRLYAAEAVGFAEATATAVAEVWLRNPDDEWE